MEKNKVFIFNLWHTMNNYGANLTAYALQEILKTLNYDPELVNNAFHKTERKNKSSNCSIQFWNKYLQTSKNFVNDVNALNNEADKFIVGSDQVFRPIYMGHKTREYLLDFVKPDSKKIALAASFGVDKNYFLEENPREQVEQMKKSLQSFDYVSVRENAGVEICCDIMGVEAEWIIDPVFILDKSYYEKLICNATEDYSDRIVSYVLDPNADYRQARKYLEKQYNTKVVELANSNTSVENWLSAIKNCKFLVTDSFHGACFAIMFNKPFIVCLANRGNATTRFESILSLLNIENKCINSYNEILQKDSVNCLLLRPKGLSGQKYMDLNQDTPNYDQITGEQIGVSTDTSAYGEIFKSGFSLPILIQISLDAIATQHVDNSQGQGSDIHRIASISGCSYPTPMRGDMIVITETDERYFFDQITSESLFKGLFPFTYKGTMRLIPRNQVQYKIPLRDLKACCCCLIEGDNNSCQQI